MLGGQESRGVLRKISDMLEVIMKRMDALSKLGNTTDNHRLDELSSALDRYNSWSSYIPFWILMSVNFVFISSTMKATHCLVRFMSEDGSISPVQTVGNCSRLVRNVLCPYSL